MSERAPAVVDPRPFDHARQQIARIRDAVLVLCDAIRDEQMAIAARDAFVSHIASALIGHPNPANAGKPHSQASAEAWAKEQDEYKQRAVARIEAGCARLCASAAYDAAKLSAKLTVAAVAGDVVVSDHARLTGDLRS